MKSQQPPLGGASQSSLQCAEASTTFNLIFRSWPSCITLTSCSSHVPLHWDKIPNIQSQKEQSMFRLTVWKIQSMLCRLQPLYHTAERPGIRTLLLSWCIGSREGRGDREGDAPTRSHPSNCSSNQTYLLPAGQWQPIIPALPGVPTDEHMRPVGDILLLNPNTSSKAMETWAPASHASSLSPHWDLFMHPFPQSVLGTASPNGRTQEILHQGIYQRPALWVQPPRNIPTAMVN